MSFLLAARFSFAAGLLAVAYLSLAPDPEVARGGFKLARWIATLVFGDDAMADKIGHFFSYLSLGAIGVAARLPVVALIAALIGYGAVLEVLQGLGGVRTPDVTDGLVNALGAALGAGLVLAIGPRRTAA